MTVLGKDLWKEGDGILRLKPAWVPRSFCRPGRRIKLHPDDYYVLGLERGGIDERWFSSTTPAENGPGTPPDEGLSYAVSADGRNAVLLKDAVAELKEKIVGENIWKKYGKWPMFSKFFDNAGPLPHHVHHREQHAKRVGAAGKPEMYFFPSQMNPNGGEFPYTFFGLNPQCTKEEIRSCLENFTKGDNRLLEASQAYKIELDTGWDVPPGVLHAPASLCTYEPQFASDVYAMYQSVLPGGHCVPVDLLWKNCPPEERGNFDYLIDVIDWEKNVDPDFKAHRFMRPIVCGEDERYREEWICYKSPLVCAKRLTVYPGQTVTVRDSAAYGFILIQGRGRCGNWEIETPTLIRYGELTNDEFFVTEEAAGRGVVVTNTSKTENIVMLKHFAENPDLPPLA
ncbi:MAG: hypothetical protein SOT34_03880 [Candidatus Borkfalkiaceae bacterium]|nr:hypothetical protein [Christensenellaceae bacterium]